jgi:argininosuccinate synthase
MKQSRIAVPYAGGAEPTAALRALAAASRGEVVTLTLDLGQGGELGPVRDAAIAAGAARAHVIDARDLFARDYVVPALRQPPGGSGWPALIRTLAAPLVAAKLHEIAAIEQATVPVDAPRYEVESSLVGRIVSGDVHRLTTAAMAAPDAPAYVEIAIANGVPVAINDVPLPLIELFESLTLIAGQHGVGRVDGVEAPAAVVLHAALQTETNGVVRLNLFKGSCEPAPALVSQQ